MPSMALRVESQSKMTERKSGVGVGGMQRRKLALRLPVRKCFVRLTCIR
jgi:hypothetical protein